MFIPEFNRAIEMIKHALNVCCCWEHLRATGGVALLVGSWLTLVNQADIIAGQGLDAVILLKVAINYLTPFVVSNIGLLVRRM